jgi:hypothetical protein
VWLIDHIKLALPSFSWPFTIQLSLLLEPRFLDSNGGALTSLAISNSQASGRNLLEADSVCW